MIGDGERDWAKVFVGDLDVLQELSLSGRREDGTNVTCSMPSSSYLEALLDADPPVPAQILAQVAHEFGIRKTAISHDFADLPACDAAASEIRRWALGYAATGGGAAGAFGVIGLAVDVPATITLALRTCRLTGLCYGFGDDSVAERVFILDTLQLAGANSMADTAEALARVSADRQDLPAESWGRIVRLTGQTAGAQAAARRVAQVLGVNLSARKFGQLAPIVGAAIGAGVNTAFQNDVSLAARHAYRERWLQVNEGIIRGEVVDKRGGVG